MERIVGGLGCCCLGEFNYPGDGARRLEVRHSYAVAPRNVATAEGSIRMICRAVAWLLLMFCACAHAGESPFAQRGYYMTFMRMPAFGLAEWKEIVDCIEEDEGNTLLLWTAGGFRSRQFPETWAYNSDHRNVQADFVRELVDYAHTKNIKVLLCFTPFAYDGVNQYTLSRPELRAIARDGKETQFWGMHSWGYNLCPSKPESQRFMLGYAREMIFDFYPNADGLMIESSDYAICYCKDCGTNFFQREFEFVKKISDEVWKKKPAAMIAVYPHYFTGAKVPGFDVPAATEMFNTNWTLFFTPHSAHIDVPLVQRAAHNIYSSDVMSLGTPARIRDSARLAKRHGISGFIPSCEPFTCPTGPPGNRGPRMKPFHLGWLGEGQMPLNELPVRVNRIAYRAYSGNPDLSDEEFRRILSKTLFGEQNSEATEDALFLNRCCFEGANWFIAPALLAGPASPKLEQVKTAREELPRLRQIVERYANATSPNQREMHKIATWIVTRWKD